jgi:hypothetical protein
MLGRMLSPPRTETPLLVRWRKGIVIVLACLAILAGVTYAARCALLLNFARIILNRDSGLVAQERADSVAISFAKPPPAWIALMKNQMNDIWDPIKANGVNYYMFAGPRTWFTPYSERSNPLSPYYQAWVGAYVIKQRDGSLPADLETLAWQVTALDQRSWLSAMGDPRPLADASQATRVGNILIDGHSWPLWHGTMQSHSDLSADASGPLPTLIGMPPKSSWPSGVASHHEVSLDGYFACWVDPQRKVSVVIYGVAATYTLKLAGKDDPGLIKDEILNIMKSARLQAVN